MTESVIVVGGGIAGLVAARDLARSGAAVTVVEASGALGGMLRQHQVAGVDLDMAAESFAMQGNIVADLIGELGLENRVEKPAVQGAWLMTARGTTAPLPQAGVLGIPSDPTSAEVVRIIGPDAARIAGRDHQLPATVGSEETTLGGLVRARMGERVLDDLVVPVVTGVYSAHPDTVLLTQAAPWLQPALLREGTLSKAVLTQRSKAPAGSAVAGLQGGMITLVDALVADLARLHVKVHLRTKAGHVSAQEVQVTSSGHTETTGVLRADHVIVTTTGLSHEESLDTEAIELVTLVVDQHELDAAPRGTGMLVHPDASVTRAKALTHATAKWRWLAQAAEGRHIIRLSYKVPAERVESRSIGASTEMGPQDARVQSACADASAMLGVELAAKRDVVGAATVRWLPPILGTQDFSDGVIPIGEAQVGRGLARVIALSRRTAARLTSATESTS